MFHHFPDLPEIGQNCLVSSTNFTYQSDSTDLSSDHAVPLRDSNPIIYSFLKSVRQTGYKRDLGGQYIQNPCLLWSLPTAKPKLMKRYEKLIPLV